MPHEQLNERQELDLCLAFPIFLLQHAALFPGSRAISLYRMLTSNFDRVLNLILTSLGLKLDRNFNANLAVFILDLHIARRIRSELT